jgi:hypothetical protein
MPQRRRAKITNFKVGTQSKRGTTEEKDAAFKETQGPGTGTSSGVVPKITAPLGVGEP